MAFQLIQFLLMLAQLHMLADIGQEILRTEDIGKQVCLFSKLVLGSIEA
jgi:hypothetical protein